MHEISLNYSQQIIRQAVFGFWWRVVGFRYLVALTLVAVGLAAQLLRGNSSWFVGILASVLVLGIGFMVAIYVVHYRNALDKLQTMGPPHATLAVADTSFTLSSGAGTSTLPWTSIVEVWKLKTCWLILFSKAQFVTLPLNDLSTEAQAFIRERVKASGGKVS